MSHRLRKACAISLATPLAAALGWLLFVTGGDAVGAGPFAGLGPRNGAEAAGMARAADVLRYIRMGEDPNALHDVRPEVISSAVLRVTTLEAAMWSRQLELVKLLDGENAIKEGDRAMLACLAADLGVDDVVEYLAPEGIGGCTPGQALERVSARSRGL